MDNTHHLVREYIHLAEQRSRKFIGQRRPCPSLYCRDEAKSDALKALHHAALKHDPSRVSEFGGYASVVIDRALNSNLMQKRRIKLKETTLIDEPHAATEDLEHDEISRIREIIEGLPHNRRVALKMKYLEGRSYEEIGHALGKDGEPMKKGTVSVHLTKGLDDIRKEFGIETVYRKR